MHRQKPDRIKNWTRGFNGTLIALTALTIGLNRPIDSSEMAQTPVEPSTRALADAVGTDAVDLLPAGPAVAVPGVKLALAVEARSDTGTALVDVTLPPEIDQITDTTPDDISPETLDDIRARRAALDLMASPVVKQDPEPPRLRVDGRVVSVRAGPGTRYGIVTSLSRDTIVTPTGATDGSWAQIVLADRSEPVWMHSAYLADVDDS